MRSLLSLLIVLLLISTGCARRSGPDLEAERDRKFQEMMSGVTLVGYSTRLNKPGVSGEERYVIDKVSRIAGDQWLFQSRLKYEEREIPVPIPLTIRWAGDTPVITFTDLAIPGVGTFTARVLLYRDQYAGTWSGKNYGGTLFGRIERQGKP